MQPRAVSDVTARVRPDSTTAEITPLNVEELAIATHDGFRMRVGATGEAILETLAGSEGRRGEIYRGVLELRERYGDDIRKRFASVAPLLPGIRLEYLLEEHHCDLAKVLAGSGSTCVFIREATVRLPRIGEHRSFVVMRFPGVVKAAEQVPEIQKHEPLAIEALGGKLVVELAGEDETEVRERGEALIEVFARTAEPPAMELVLDAADRRRVRLDLDEAVAAIPNPERAVLSPDRLAPPIEELLHVLERYGSQPAIFGDFARGYVGCGIDRNLFTAEGRADYERFAVEAAQVCARFKGGFSARYCDGPAARQVMRVLYGEEMLTALDAFKRIWDPDDRMSSLAPA